MRLVRFGSVYIQASRLSEKCVFLRRAFYHLLVKLTFIGVGFEMGRVRDEHAASYHPMFHSHTNDMVEEPLEYFFALKAIIPVPADRAVVQCFLERPRHRNQR